jgi:hypothetical protein
VSVIRQLSLLGADAAPPEPDDLAGLLLAGGRITRYGDSAQVTVDVGHPWRAAAIVTECGRRGLAATSTSASTGTSGADGDDGHAGATSTSGAAQLSVRTACAAALVGLAQAWTDDVGLRVPRGLQLDGRVLRLWAMAVGHRDGSAYVLPISGPDQVFRDAVGAALASVGLVAQLVSRREVTFRIVGKRRLDRLVEMVGDPPKQAPPDIWPS